MKLLPPKNWQASNWLAGIILATLLPACSISVSKLQEKAVIPAWVTDPQSLFGEGAVSACSPFSGTKKDTRFATLIQIQSEFAQQRYASTVSSVSTLSSIEGRTIQSAYSHIIKSQARGIIPPLTIHVEQSVQVSDHQEYCIAASI
jgi:hypothetical protein